MSSMMRFVDLAISASIAVECPQDRICDRLCDILILFYSIPREIRS